MMQTQAPPSHWEYQVVIDLPAEGPATFTAASHGFAELLGYAPDEILGLAIDRVVAREDHPLLSEIRDGVNEGGWEGRLRLCTSEGEALWVEVAAEFHNDGGARKAHARLHDIAQQVVLESELQEREARIQALSERLKIAMWSTDTSLRITWMWGSGLQEIGLEENELVGKTMHEYLGTDDPAFPPLDAAARALEGERVVYELNWQGRDYRSTIEPRRGPDGEITGLIGTAIDITDSSKLFEETVDLGKDLGAPRLRSHATGSDEVLQVGALTIDVDSHVVTKGSDEIDLTPTEFRLLTELARRPGRVLSREILLQRVWGHNFLGGGSLIKMAVKRLRDKVEDDPLNPVLIETVRGVGYRLHPDEPK